MSKIRQPLAITSGEPAGIGPDLCLQLAAKPPQVPLVVLGDPHLLERRASELNLSVKLNIFADAELPSKPLTPGQLAVLPIPLAENVHTGQLNPNNADYVLELLDTAIDGCLDGRFAGLVTAPIHKGVINDAGIAFTGHTEYLAERTQAHPVMMLACPGLRVALATTHLPLKAVSEAITQERLTQVIEILHRDLNHRFKLADPRILVCGLNPHAGEGGHLGREEIDVLEPVLTRLRAKGMQLEGPLPADTLFTPRWLDNADAVLAMYHDQGLPVLKYKGFGQAVNITLGLPIIRTSVDHGTALDLAGSGRADSNSLLAAITLATEMTSQ